jgi:hypothetical protein
MKVRSKHIGYNAQREQCRLNKYTYIEKIFGVPVLCCNYPFDKPTHKKGLCKASTCTDMREIPDDVVAADKGKISSAEIINPNYNQGKPMSAGDNADAPDKNKEESFDDGAERITEEMNKEDSMGLNTEDKTEMPCPENE